ncbi:hypothetical protein FB45DRAFT_211882 [Roridomyces roridus]|uniref:Uncharacterized protein n=1 Tax=Roridomyces roridus TaxID=1738132 RepID=A0AAD7FXA0_9AGAR|nr:hypothetical protein FB45DRAFT_211882 [Roridomyces roridus]
MEDRLRSASCIPPTWSWVPRTLWRPPLVPTLLPRMTRRPLPSALVSMGIITTSGFMTLPPKARLGTLPVRLCKPSRPSTRGQSTIPSVFAAKRELSAFASAPALLRLFSSTPSRTTRPPGLKDSMLAGHRLLRTPCRLFVGVTTPDALLGRLFASSQTLLVLTLYIKC